MTSNWVDTVEDNGDQGAYGYELKLTTGDTGLDNGWELCFDTPFPAGRNSQEMEQARSDSGLSLGANSCVMFQLPGTHRCIRNCDQVAKNDQFILHLYSQPWSLAKSDFFQNYYLVERSDTVSVFIILI